MNLEQLQYIMEVSKSGSLTMAAQKSHITLSAISQSISLLENELGVTLFTRSRGQSAVPTPEGQRIIEKATKILMKVNELKEEANQFNHTLAGELRIATIPGPTHLLVETVARFKKDYPNVKIEILEKGPKEIVENILANQMDIGLMVLDEDHVPKSNDLVFEIALEGKMVVGVNKNSALSTEKFVTPDMLKEETLVLYEDEIIRNFIEKNIAEYDKLDVLFSTNNTYAIDYAVVEGAAVTIGLDFSFHKNRGNHEQIITIDLKTPENQTIPYGWVRHKSKPSSQIAKTFIDRLRLDI
ncbi:LysR family transcriptional regulator [Bacillus sp. FJAT-49736]|uniref:LysR family transcriptional regulator n=1 Tax=Bacillus sp. FJAT-49736 TaxID=2833582 RepID=UPI001BC9BE6F|nr:LysR family transcriptional regulator [Bacillus sp. FJAT-49736]MBS4174355.1 LysR family transcriptional regulator [Bacillus sp. FJAT-49736]